MRTLYLNKKEIFLLMFLLWKLLKFLETDVKYEVLSSLYEVSSGRSCGIFLAYLEFWFFLPKLFFWDRSNESVSEIFKEIFSLRMCQEISFKKRTCFCCERFVNKWRNRWNWEMQIQLVMSMAVWKSCLLCHLPFSYQIFSASDYG